MKKILLLFILSFSTVAFSCKKQTLSDNELKGLLKKQGFTTYQYGSHTLTTSSTTYALKSSVIDLDKYVNRTVIITGDKVTGYPVDGGPDYIEVKTIR